MKYKNNCLPQNKINDFMFVLYFDNYYYRKRLQKDTRKK